MYQNNQIRLVYPGCDRCDWSIGIGLSAEMYRYNCQRPLDSFQMRCRSDVKNHIMLSFIGLNLFPLRLETEPSMVKVCFLLFYLERPSDYGQIMDYSFVLTPRPISESKTLLGTLAEHCSPLAESGRLGIAFKVETFCKLQ